MRALCITAPVPDLGASIMDGPQIIAPRFPDTAPDTAYHRLLSQPLQFLILRAICRFFPVEEGREGGAQFVLVERRTVAADGSSASNGCRGKDRVDDRWVISDILHSVLVKLGKT
jgi:hypothetical protein